MNWLSPFGLVLQFGFCAEQNLPQPARLKRYFPEAAAGCDFPALRSTLTDRAWDFMIRHADEITPTVMGWADALARGGDIRAGHIGAAIRQQRRLLPNRTVPFTRFTHTAKTTTR